MDGLGQIAVRISMIVLTQPVSMVPPVLMVLAVSIAAVYRVKRVYCAIWMMHAHQTLAIQMLFVIQAQSMDRTLAPAHRDTKVSIVPKILMSAIKDHHANTMEFALIHQDHSLAIAHKDSRGHGVKPMLMSVKVIHARMMAVASTIRAHFDAFACQVSKPFHFPLKYQPTIFSLK